MMGNPDTSARDAFDAALDRCPIIAILRGVTPDEAVSVAHALIRAGVTVAEVPLNSPDPFASIARMVEASQGRLFVGAGTVLTSDDVDRVTRARGRLTVAPNTSADVIQAAMARGVVPLPGVATATEAFAAVQAGATRLKLFPAAEIGLGAIPALTSVLPKGVRLTAVGGIGQDTAKDWIAAGARGIGVGTALYRPGRTVDEIEHRARMLVSATHETAPAFGVTCLDDARAVVGESPVVDTARGSVFWLDMVSKRLHRHDFETQANAAFNLDQMLTSLVHDDTHGLRATTEDALVRVSPDGQTIATLSTWTHASPDQRFNDATLSPDGVVYAGVMSRAALAGRGCIIAFPPQGAPVCAYDGLGVVNGMAVTPDGSTLYVVDTLFRTLMAFDLTGWHVSNPRILSDFLSVPGKPDGMALCPDGRLAVAMWGGGGVVLLTPAGVVDQFVSVPAPHTGACAVHPHADGTWDLVVTTSTMRLPEHDLSRFPHSGGVFATKAAFGAPKAPGA